MRLLEERGHDVLAAGLVPELARLDDPILFAVAQREGRLTITHNSHDFPSVLGEWAEAGRRHCGCIISYVPTNAYAEMTRRLDRWFAAFPANAAWIDRAVAL